MQSRNIIDDGYTLSARIAAVQGQHDGMEFKFRPMLQEEFERVEGAVQKVGGERGVPIIAKALAGQIFEWSEVTATGDAIPISTDAIRRHRLITQMYRIVAGIEPYDLVTDPTAEEVDEYAEQFEGPAPLAKLMESEGN